VENHRGIGYRCPGHIILGEAGLERSGFRQLHPSIQLGLCGAGSGIVSWLVHFFDIDPVAHLLGAVFGLAVAICLMRFHNLPAMRAAIVVVAFGLSWQAAFRFAQHLAQNFDSIALIGAIAGAVGAGILAVGCAVVMPQFRSVRPVVQLVLVGTIAGALLDLKSDLAMFALFFVWQSAVGASVGHGFARDRAG